MITIDNRNIGEIALAKIMTRKIGIGCITANLLGQDLLSPFSEISKEIA